MNNDIKTALPPAVIDLNLEDVKEYFNEQAWTKLENLCKFNKNLCVAQESGRSVEL